MQTASDLHPRNRHQGQYDFEKLIQAMPELKKHVFTNEHGTITINFFDPLAVRMLNKALLIHFYGLEYWDIPENYLCPPIPGRAEYIHRLADLLSEYPPVSGKIVKLSNSSSEKVLPKSRVILDIGVGANCIYPIIGCLEYGWAFIGSEIDPVAAESALKIVERNETLDGMVDIRFQPNRSDFFSGILQRGEFLAATMCNPPFHSSPEEARSKASNKLKNLSAGKSEAEERIILGQKELSGGKSVKSGKPKLNFGGQSNELWCPGGEIQFVQEMIRQSHRYAKNVGWFTTLISKKENLPAIYSALKKVSASQVKTIEMGHGNKKSRIVAWRFLL